MTIQGVPIGPGLRLHLNENTGGCSPSVVEAVRSFTAERLALYPDFTDAVRETAALFGVDPEWMVLTNGLDEGILLASIAYLVPRAPQALVELGRRTSRRRARPEIRWRSPPSSRTCTPRPPWAHAWCRCRQRPDFAFPVDAMLRAITPSTRIIFLNNPNNPTGQPIPRSHPPRRARGAAMRWCSSTRRITTSWARTSWPPRPAYPNVIVGRTFSKAYGLAGMRVGCDRRLTRRARADARCDAAVQPQRGRGGRAARRARRSRRTGRGIWPRRRSRRRWSTRRARGWGCSYWKSAANFVLIDGGDRTNAIVAG